MNRALFVPLVKLSVCALTLISLLLLWRFHSSDGLGAVAAVTSIIVAGPVTLLVAIDFGRALRRTPVSPSAKRISLAPQFLLGGLSCLSGVVIVPLVLLETPQNVLLKALGCVAGATLFLYGMSLLRETR
jgi:hypothetical protein